MGFPAPVYAEVPRLLLNLVFLLDHLRCLSSWLLRLADARTDDDLSFHYSSNSTTAGSADHRHEDHGLEELEEHAPAVRFDALSASGTRDDSTLLPEGCVVCLTDFHGATCVRRPWGCRHVFHRGRLNRWSAHGHRTCPLCRAPFLPPLPLPAS